MGEKRNVGKILKVFGEVKWRGFSLNANIGGAFGITVINDDAFASSAWRDPLIDSEDSWYWWGPLIGDEPTTESIIQQVNTKTTRLLKGDQETLALILENSSSSSTSLVYQIALRILYEKT